MHRLSQQQWISVGGEQHSRAATADGIGHRKAGRTAASDPTRAVVAAATAEDILAEYGSNLKLLECNPQVAELLTIIRDK